MQQPDRELAKRLRTAALERRGQLDEDSTIALYRAALRADPGYFPAAFEYIGIMLEQFRNPELRREFPVSDSSTALAQCLAAGARFNTDDRRPVAQWRAIEERYGTSPCTDAFLLWAAEYDSVRGARALRDSPELLHVRAIVANGMSAAGQAKEADALMRAGGPALEDPLATTEFAFARLYFRLARADTAGAIAQFKAIEQQARRDPRPIALSRFLFNACTGSFPSVTPASRTAACNEHWELTRGRRSGSTRWDVARRQGKFLLETGAPAEAIPPLNRAVALAESIGVPGLRLISLTQRGRAYTHLGRPESALRDLRKAVAIGSSAALPYYLAEAYHNLAHAYERAGRLSEATFAGDTFAMITDQLPNTPGRYMSRHDQGMILWAGGWHAAATRSFEAMVRVVDEQNDGHAFAGEYYERIGLIGRALDYYRAGARMNHGDPRNAAALARLYEALGMPDSAEAAARTHLALRDRWPLLERPLLPDMLARRGRVREAIALADAWARRETAAGNVQGAARSWIHVAELHLLNRDPRAGERAARSADSLGRLLMLTAEGIEARTVLGRALVAQGNQIAGIGELRAAVRLATAHPSTAGLLSTHAALGEALESSGKTIEALVEYDRAATAVEKMTAGLDDDVNRAGFKSRHLAPFDGAVRVLAGKKTMKDAAAALEWSARRKAAALALAGQRDTARLPRLDALSLRSRLQPDEALIDFTVLDSSITAIVARRTTISLVRLGVAPARVTSWIETLRRPFVTTPGGRIDLAHARFNAAIAESLHTTLIGPLAPGLVGVKRMAIVPDGALWYLPFAALVPRRKPDAPTNGAMRPTYLLEQYEIRLLPSATFLARRDAATALKPGFRVDALAYAVAGGSAEMTAIDAALGSPRVIRRDGATATERAALGTRADVLHIAAHGVVDDRDPLASHLRLAPAGNDDGLLHLSEVTANRIAPRLVVLTACEAVSGRLYAGEGLVGLARAFLLSGAHQVIASLWPVDASAGELTSVFYRELARGQSAPTALRSGQLSMLNNPSSAHPIHWAGFVSFGGRSR